MSTSRVFTVGQVLTAAQMMDLPQGVLSRGTSTGSVGPTSGTTELDVIAAGAATIAGTNRRITVVFRCRSLVGSVAGDVFELRIKEGATILAGFYFSVSVANVGWTSPPVEYNIDPPTAASHTYKVTIQRILGTGTATVEATASEPLQIVVRDEGQV